MLADLGRGRNGAIWHNLYTFKKTGKLDSPKRTDLRAMKNRTFGYVDLMCHQCQVSTATSTIQDLFPFFED
ncbi:MAG: hypothetical protein CL912_07190 [Deltaproteobacteria bacterium]|nr:hypothetical protein [Deltaproteobacteria bacterium]